MCILATKIKCKSTFTLPHVSVSVSDLFLCIFYIIYLYGFFSCSLIRNLKERESDFPDVSLGVYVYEVIPGTAASRLENRPRPSHLSRSFQRNPSSLRRHSCDHAQLSLCNLCPTVCHRASSTVRFSAWKHSTFSLHHNDVSCTVRHVGSMTKCGKHRLEGFFWALWNHRRFEREQKRCN